MNTKDDEIGQLFHDLLYKIGKADKVKTFKALHTIYHSSYEDLADLTECSYLATPDITKRLLDLMIRLFFPSEIKEILNCTNNCEKHPTALELVSTKNSTIGNDRANIFIDTLDHSSIKSEVYQLLTDTQKNSEAFVQM